MAEKTILIKQGDFELRVPRSQLVEVAETADGVSFNFKNGISVLKIDGYMPMGTKNLIKNTLDNFPTANITVDLGNYSKPVFADVT
jgi:hypothetical protein